MEGHIRSNEAREEEASQCQAAGRRGGGGADGSRDKSLRGEVRETGRRCGVSFSDFRLASDCFRLISDW